LSWYASETEQWYSSQDSQWEGVSDDTCALLFNFSIGGYTPPSFTDVPFNFVSTYAKIMNLGASVEAVPTYQDSTYTYVKSRRLYGLGYCYGGGYQIIKQMMYGGIRDLGALITAIKFKSSYVDLNAMINAIKYYSGTKDLRAQLKVMFRDEADLRASLRSWHIFDLKAIIGSVFETDLPAIINSILPVDLGARLRIYYSKDLRAILHGWQLFDLGAFIKGGLRYYLDLKAIIGVYAPYDLKGVLIGWKLKVPIDLPAVLGSYHYYDLGATLISSYFKNLKAIIYGIPYMNLPAFIHGWDILDLKAKIVGGYGPGDLLAIIYGIAGFDLGAEINPIKRLYLNLMAQILGLSKFDLGAKINAVGGTLLLRAIIEATGGFNLGATITPRVVKLAKVLRVHTMNVVNLTAVINMAPCFNFELVDLGARLKALYFSDLTATVYGFRNIAQQTFDLRAIIMSDVYPDKLTFDTINIVFSPPDKYVAIDYLPVSFWDKKLAFDEISIRFRAKGYMASPFDITATIFGEFLHFDLKAKIKAIFNVDRYLDILEDSFYAPYLVNNIEVWKRFVELKFYSMVYKYFYDSFSDAVWKDDTSQKWVIDVSSFRERFGFFDFLDRRTKLVFDLDKFNSVDEAIRYAIDWVLILPTTNLIATINASGGYVGLTAKINAGLSFVKTFSSLKASVVCFSLKDLTAYLNSVVIWKDLGAKINS